MTFVPWILVIFSFLISLWAFWRFYLARKLKLRALQVAVSSKSYQNEIIDEEGIDEETLALLRELEGRAQEFDAFISDHLFDLDEENKKNEGRLASDEYWDVELIKRKEPQAGHATGENSGHLRLVKSSD